MRDRFLALQQRLDAAWRTDLPGSNTEHLVVALPSYSVDPVLLAHYADRLPPLEHRYLCCILLLARPETQVAYVASTSPPDYIVDEYLRLLPEQAMETVHDRLHLLSVDDLEPRSLAEKVLERPDVLDRLRQLAMGRPAFIEPWNVTAAERDLALAIDVPLFGADPDLWTLATKSAGRQLFRDVGVPVPEGVEDVRTLDDVLDAIARVRSRRGELDAVIIKLNDSASGDGNAVIDLTGLPQTGSPDERGSTHTRLQALPGWYVQSLRAQGGVVEERISGEPFRSPSVQVSVTPAGDAVVLSTHDQVLGGHAGQVYQGCRFPADAEYASDVARLAGAVSGRLAELDVRGRLAVDFAARPGAGGGWDLFALEINLRKGGTTHPFATMRNLCGGGYDAGSGTYKDSRGRSVHYVATDNYVDDAWRSIDPVDLQAAVRDEDLTFDRSRGSGVVLHLLNCLPVDGRFGVTAIASSGEEADALYNRVGSIAAALS